MKQPVLLLSLAVLVVSAVSGQDLRLGIAGTDTSHAIVFTKAFNGPPGPDHVDGARVVAAYKGGSPDVESSRTRVDKFADQLRTEWGIEIVEDIPTLCGKVDAVLLESVDGRVHLEQVKPVLAAKKPVFIDKPLAATLEDAREIARLAKQAGVPWFSSSSLRWSEVVTMTDTKEARAISVWGPGPFEEHHYLELAWYAIHPIEMLYAMMGPGCVEVTRTSGESADVITGRWKDGRLGTVHALRPYGGYGAAAFLPKEIVQSPPKAQHSYTPLLREIVKFFRTGVPPVPNEETLEIFAFMDAAQKSKEQRGEPVKLR